MSTFEELSWTSKSWGRSHHKRLAVDRHVAYHWKNSAVKSWNKSRKMRPPVSSRGLEPGWAVSTTRNLTSWATLSSQIKAPFGRVLFSQKTQWLQFLGNILHYRKEIFSWSSRNELLMKPVFLASRALASLEDQSQRSPAKQDLKVTIILSGVSIMTTAFLLLGLFLSGVSIMTTAFLLLGLFLDN
jgi:hypothetical protein